MPGGARRPPLLPPIPPSPRAQAHALDRLAGRDREAARVRDRAAAAGRRRHHALRGSVEGHRCKHTLPMLLLCAAQASTAATSEPPPLLVHRPSCRPALPSGAGRPSHEAVAGAGARRQGAARGLRGTRLSRHGWRGGPTPVGPASAAAPAALHAAAMHLLVHSLPRPHPTDQRVAMKGSSTDGEGEREGQGVGGAHGREGSHTSAARCSLHGRRLPAAERWPPPPPHV